MSTNYRMQFDTDAVERTDRSISIPAKTVTINIIDTESGIESTGIEYMINPSATPGFNDLTFLSGVLPEGTDSLKVYISTDNGASWTEYTDILVNLTEPTTFTIAVGIYKIVLHYTEGDTEVEYSLSEAEVIYLQPAMSPLVIEVVDNNEDKFTPIRAKQAIIQFLSNTSEGQSMTTFSDSSDNRWKVIIDVDGEIIFIGFLMLTDMQQPFLPDPQVITLTASDHLGILKDIPLTDDDGLNPQGKYTLGQLIAMALKKTGLELEIIVINNIKHGTGQRTFTTTFSFSGQYFVTDGVLTTYFYVGQRLTISGTVSNNGTVTVTEVTNNGTVTQVSIDAAIVAESASATFTDESSTGHFYEKILIDAKTFETSIGVSEDCYTVLTKILKESCTLFQHNGKIMIVNINEYDNNPLYRAKFDANGYFVEYLDPITDTFDIGIAEDVCHADLQTLLRNDRQHRFIKEVFRYQNPQEIVCNINFDRGAYIEDIDDEVIDGVTYQRKKYSIECWDYAKHNSKGAASDPPDTDCYLVRLFYNGLEKDRYVQVETPVPHSYLLRDSLASTTIRVEKDDNFELSYDVKFETSENQSLNTFGIELIGDDGNYYYWAESDETGGHWYQYVVGQDSIKAGSAISAATDEGQWITQVHSRNDRIPVSGYLRLYLYPDLNGTSTYVKFANLRFELIPFINGSFKRYTGQYNQVTRNPTAGYNAIQDDEVFISDSPRPTFKGAMFFLNDTVYKPSALFYKSNLYALGYPTDDDAYNTFGYWQAWAVWNQYRNANRIFPSGLYGIIRSDDQWADLWQKYQLTDANENTDSRYFILISFRQDWKTMRWSGTFIEVYRTDLGHVYDDTWTASYITD